MSNATPFISLVTVVDQDADSEVQPFATAIAEHYPLYELIAVTRNTPTSAPTLANLHILQLSGIIDDRMRYTAGLDRCIGDVVVIVDVAVDTPAAAVQAIQAIINGSPAVYQAQAQGHIRAWKQTTGAHMLTRLTGINAPHVQGVRAFDREVLDSWLRHRDRDRLLELFPAVTGHQHTVLPATTLPSAKHTRPTRWRLAAITAASPTPLRIAYGLAILGAVCNLLYSLYVVLVNIVKGDTVEGWTSLSLQIAGMFFLVSLILAALAEYIYQVVKRNSDQHLYTVKQEQSSPSLPVMQQINIESDTSE